MTTVTLDQTEQMNELAGFLQSQRLPHQDLTLTGNLFMTYRDEGGIAASGGIEFYSTYGLLRSLAVRTDLRNKALGKRMVADLIKEAGKRSVTKVFLLTETAPDFFQHLGFTKVTRDVVPDAVKLSSEFSTVCPVSAICMEKSVA